MEKSPNPVLVEVLRGDVIETRHRGSLVIANYEGKILASYGDVEERIFIRSAAKPMQEIPLIESGAADYFKVTDQELSIGSASHDAELIHEETVRNWLSRIGLSEDYLECGIPNSDINFEDLMRRGVTEYKPIHNTCSGKHANFLTAAKHLGYPLKNYIDINHPIQQLVKRTLGEMTGADMDSLPMAIEGCGVPAFAFSRLEIAIAYAKYANPKILPKKRAEACQRIMNAMMKYPAYFGGSKRFDSIITNVLGGVICKRGSRGTEIAIIPQLGLGIAVKIDDGTSFAKECAMCNAIDSLGLINETQRLQLKKFMSPDMINARGEVVGVTRANQDWLENLKSIRGFRA